MDISRLIFKNTSFQVIGKIITVLSSLLLTWVIRRQLHTEGYGIYVFVTAFVLFFGNIADWGTNLIAVREASLSDNKKVVFSSALILRFVFSLVGFMLVNVAIRLNPEWKEFVPPATIASLVLLFLSLKTSLGIVFQTAIRLGSLTFIEVVSSLLFLILGFLAILRGFGIGGVFGAWVASTAVAVVIAVFFAKNSLSLAFNAMTAKRIIKEALPTGILLVVFSIYNRVDVVILQHFWGVSQVGVYGLSYKIYETLVVGAAFIMNSTYPLLSAEKDHTRLRLVFQKSFDVLLGLSLVLVFITIILSPTILLIFGPSANSSVAPLRILSLGLIFSYLNHLTGYSLIAFGKQTISLLIGTLALVLNIIINWMLIPHYSYLGASWITVATEGFVFILSSAAVFKVLRFYPSLFSFPKTIYSLLSSYFSKQCRVKF